MARTNNLNNFLTDVASAIKTKKGSQTDIPAADFDTEITNLPSQGTYQQKSVNIGSNGSTEVTPDRGYDALSKVTVTTAVPEKRLQTKSYTFTQNTNIQLRPETGYDGFDQVNLSINVGGDISSYTELEYIESTGTQYIDTDITPDENTKIIINFQLTDTSNNQALVSAYSNWQERCYMLFVYNGINWTFGRPTKIINTDTSKHTISLYKGVVICDGNTIQNITTDTYSGINRVIRLFASHAGYNSKMKLYSFKIYDNTDTLIRDFIPVKDEDDEACLYDKITKEYFYNTGSGDFIAGPEKTRLKEKDVNFYDYDGTLLYAYTASEFASLSALPANPTHTGLTSQGWNWTLSDAKTYVSNYGMLSVGQMYTITDNKTRIYVTLNELSLSPAVGFAVNGTVTIDWGDGNTDTVTGTSTTTVIYTKHTYSNIGDYIISLSSASNIYIIGNSSVSQLLVYYDEGTSQYSPYKTRTFSQIATKIELGSNVVIGNYAFINFCNLKTILISSGIANTGTYIFNNNTDLQFIVLPTSMTTINDRVFNYCTRLKKIVLSNSVTSIGDNSFISCYDLEEIIIPTSIQTIGSSNFTNKYKVTRGVYSTDNSSFTNLFNLEKASILSGVTTIATQGFRNCFALIHIKIPASVTTISSAAFQYCGSMEYYDFTDAVSIPTLADTDAFTGIPDDCKIIVPDSLYNDWIVAQYWSTYANNIIRESEV